MKAQINFLVRFLKPFIWILDSGASNHMKGKKDLLRKLKEKSSMLFYLPNVSKPTTRMVGHVTLSPEIELFDVLYVPEFNLQLDIYS